MQTIRDRVIELRKVPANELIENPKNWRKHPPSQRSAMAGVLGEIGLADAVIARETPEGLQLIDGHLRQEVMGNALVPVLVVDLTEEAADKSLLTLDPLTSMAITDTDKLLGLLGEAEFTNSSINDMLEALANGERHPMPDWSQYEPPDQNGIEERVDALENRFTKEREDLDDRMLELVCPECGNEFSIHQRELKYDFDVDS